MSKQGIGNAKMSGSVQQFEAGGMEEYQYWGVRNGSMQARSQLGASLGDDPSKMGSTSPMWGQRNVCMGSALGNGVRNGGEGKRIRGAGSHGI